MKKKNLGFYVAIAGLVYAAYLAGVSAGKGEIIASLIFVCLAILAIVDLILWR
ncbi:MAG: hypothetical protein Q8N56_04480 [bacterium]|nr:hypothetical protein [bacterium]